MTMDNTRLFLFAALIFVGMLMWQQWQIDYGPKPVDSVEAPAQVDEDGIPVEIVADDALGETGCEIHTPFGIIDASLDTQLDAIERAMRCPVPSGDSRESTADDD